MLCIVVYDDWKYLHLFGTLKCVYVCPRTLMVELKASKSIFLRKLYIMPLLQ